MRNRPHYLESVFATFKAGLLPVNINYRYTDGELLYLWTNSHSAAVVSHAEYTETCARLRSKVPNVRVWIRIGDDSDCPSWASSYQPVVSQRADPVTPAWTRSGDDLFLLYTGGTTGRPKGVMWRQDDMFRMLESSLGDQAEGSADADMWVERLSEPGPPVLPTPPLIHGTAWWFAFLAMSRGGAVVTLLRHVPRLAIFDGLVTSESGLRHDRRTPLRRSRRLGHRRRQRRHNVVGPRLMLHQYSRRENLS
jgi:3-oxocholest-4-en-26-oate---CoA ligase